MACREPPRRYERNGPAGHLGSPLGYFVGAASTLTAKASVKVSSTMSPTFTPSSFSGCCTVIVRVLPCGPLKVTEGALGSIAPLRT